MLEINWPNTMTIAKMADEMEFEALVPVGRWKGFGGVTNFNGAGFEWFSWAAGIGASTRKSGGLLDRARAHDAPDHGGQAGHHHRPHHRRPLRAQRRDRVAQSEIEMFGAPLLEHEVRYGLAVEWLEVIKRMWTEDERIRFRRKVF